MVIPPPDQQTAQESAPYEGQVGRFSRGIERLPDTPPKLHRGKFSDGIDHDLLTPPEVRRGSFADGYPHAHPEAPHKHHTTG